MASRTTTTSKPARPVPHPEDLMPLASAAELFHVNRKTLRRRIADGTVTGYRIGRLIRVDPDELRRALFREIPTRRSLA